MALSNLRMLTHRRPLTTLAVGYCVIVLLCFATGVVADTWTNFERFLIAGFLLIFAALVSVVFVVYVTATRRRRSTGHDPRGLLPRHVVAVTAASSLTITWVCIELWLRTAGKHYAPEGAIPHAAVAAVLWAISLSEILRFERFRVNESGQVDMRDRPFRRRKTDQHRRRTDDHA